MKTWNLSLATVVLGALAASYSACSAEGQDNTVPGAPSANAGSPNSGGSTDVPSTSGSGGAPTHPSAGAPAANGGAFHAGGAAANGGTHSGGALNTGIAGGPSGVAGRTGVAGAPATGGCPVATGTIADLLIDDLEDGDDAIRPIGSRVGYWYTYNDGTPGAAQVPAPSTLFKGTAPGHTPPTGLAATTSGPAFTTYGAGMGFNFNNTGTKSCPYNASAYSGIKFWAKANTGNMATMALTAMVKIPATTPTTADGGTCTAMCEDHYALKPAPVLTMAWTQYTITFAAASTTTFGQNGFGKAVPFDKANILGVQFQVAKDVAFNFSVDDITFF